MVLQLVSFLALFVILMVILYLWVSFSKTILAAKKSPVPSPAALTMLPTGFAPTRSQFATSPAPLSFQ